MRIAALSAAVAALVLTAACGGSPSQSSSGSTSPSASSTAQSTQQAAAGPVLQTIKVSETEFKITPATIKLGKAGTYDFNVANSGTSVHALAIQGNGINAQTQNLSAGQSADLKVTLTKGSYQMFCPVDGHRDLGMNGTVTVSG